MRFFTSPPDENKPSKDAVWTYYRVTITTVVKGHTFSCEFGYNAEDAEAKDRADAFAKNVFGATALTSGFASDAVYVDPRGDIQIQRRHIVSVEVKEHLRQSRYSDY